jgi:hypothetical protein
MANKKLNAAKVAKKDEFYTQMTDIERELQHYWPHFRDKVVLCNCDDPYESNFFKYFALRFNQLGLRKLICTCYNGSPIQGNELLLDFGEEDETPRKPAYKVEITEVNDMNGDGAVDLSDVRILLQNNKNVLGELKTGDFRDPECIPLLKEADIVVTNPPFSLFREYMGQLMEYDKKFLIIGHMNAIHYKEIFPLIQENKIWTGYGFNLSLVYKSPYENVLEANRKFVKQKGYNPDECIKVPGICWYTNLDHNKRHEEMDLICRYSPEEYPFYANYKAIEIGKVTNIPFDYDGIMGVPTTFLDKYNPEQFEIIGCADDQDWLRSIGVQVMGKETIKKLRSQGNMAHVTANMNSLYYIKDDKVFLPYSRIFIRNKHPKSL